MKKRYLSVGLSTALLATHAIAAQPLAPNFEFGDLINEGTFGLVKTNRRYAEIMFDRQDYVTDKSLRLLQARKNKKLDNQSLYLGGRFIGQTMYEDTNIAGKFPIISRFPDQHTAGESGTESVISDASFQVTLLPTSWLSGFLQGEYTEVEYPGQDDFQIRKYYVTIGDLSEFPVYASFGRKTVAFGDFTSYAPFTHNLSSHYFWSQTDDPHFELGYYDYGIHAVASLIPSGRGNRVINTKTDDGFDNFAFNVTYSFSPQKNVEIVGGAGYLHSTIYDSTLAHHPPGRGALDTGRNAAFNIHGKVLWEQLQATFEYTETFHEWPATAWPVSALTLQARYLDDIANLPVIYSLMFSRGEQGDNGTEWEHMKQTVLGFEIQPLNNMTVGLEYQYNLGFVPLILPTITGDRDVESHSVILGTQLTF
ncbi:MAG: hypothetical protein MRY32_07020 [Rickettsiales bacterium]|nr:hypothetical protein [Rickettsiales bacterium]